MKTTYDDDLMKMNKEKNFNRLPEVLKVMDEEAVYQFLKYPSISNELFQAIMEQWNLISFADNSPRKKWVRLLKIVEKRFDGCSEQMADNVKHLLTYIYEDVDGRYTPWQVKYLINIMWQYDLDGTAWAALQVRHFSPKEYSQILEGSPVREFILDPFGIWRGFIKDNFPRHYAELTGKNPR